MAPLQVMRVEFIGLLRVQEASNLSHKRRRVPSKRYPWMRSNIAYTGLFDKYSNEHSSRRRVRFQSTAITTRRWRRKTALFARVTPCAIRLLSVLTAEFPLNTSALTVKDDDSIAAPGLYPTANVSTLLQTASTNTVLNTAWKWERSTKVMIRDSIHCTYR